MAAPCQEAVRRFKADIANHQMTILKDDGVYRDITFRHPNTINQSFTITTWPGHLCFSGDMGTFVFQRLTDMFEFFRQPETQNISWGYWAEKCVASDKYDGVTEFDSQAFRTEVREWFDEYTIDWSRNDPLLTMLWEKIEGDVLHYADDGEYPALSALHNFTWESSGIGECFSFQDWESNCDVYTFRFTWCCLAIRWAINTYDTFSAPNNVLH